MVNGNICTPALVSCTCVLERQAPQALEEAHDLSLFVETKYAGVALFEKQELGLLHRRSMQCYGIFHAAHQRFRTLNVLLCVVFACQICALNNLFKGGMGEVVNATTKAR